MSSMIYKYTLPATSEFKIEMPSSAEILCIQVMNFTAYLWAKVDPSNPRVHRKFRIYATGEEEVYGKYVGTWIEPLPVLNSLVWHLFDQGEV